jgi:hypothetical protein
MNEQVKAVSLFLVGNPLTYLQNVMSQLSDGHAWDKNLFQEILHAFALQK